MSKPHAQPNVKRPVKPTPIPKRDPQGKGPKTHYQIDHSDTPIRLFESDFLEFFTHITPQAVVIIWLPVIVAALIFGYMGVRAGALGWGGLVGGWLAGLLSWTLIEYLMHRFVFHFSPKNASPRVERIIFLFHGVHHAQPQLKTRLVMPPVVSVPLAVVVWFLFSGLTSLAGAPGLVYPLFAGTLSGYLAYDLIHYATHHAAMRSGVWKFLKRYHMAHHYKNEDALYGVSSPVWDYVFGTRVSGV